MFANERQKFILKKIKENGAVTTSQLVDELKVSTETVRRDLLLMENEHLLTRVHGGAISNGEMQPSLPLKQRNHEYSDLKRNLARKAAEFVTEGDIIGIDAGSTAILFANAIKEKFTKLTVITYSLDVFEILRGNKEFTVILCGGSYASEERYFYGPLTLDMLDKLHMKKAFIFPAAVSLKSGISYYSENEYLLVKKMIACAVDTYVLADSSKFEKKALLKVDDMRAEYHYVTDGSLSEEIKRLYEENEINLTSSD